MISAASANIRRNTDPPFKSARHNSDVSQSNLKRYDHPHLYSPPKDYDFEAARLFLLGKLKEKGLWCRGNWERSFKDGFWSQLESDPSELVEAREVWQELNLVEYVDNGAALAREFVANQYYDRVERFEGK